MHRTNAPASIRFRDLAAGAVSRFFFAVCIALAAMGSMNFLFLCLILLFSVLALLAWGGDLKAVIRVARYVVWLFCFVFLLHLFSAEGPPLLQLWFLKATSAGARAGVLYGLKLVVFAYAAGLILLAVDPYELISPLERLARAMGHRGKLLESFAIAFCLALRFLPDLSDQARMTVLAFRTKGLDLKGGLTHKARVASLLIAPLFVNGFKRAEITASALNVKGYATRYSRAVFGPAQINLGGIITMVAAIVILLAGWRIE